MAEVRLHPLNVSRWVRCWRGFTSALRIYLVPIGNWWCRSVDHLSVAERQAKGLVLVLPGIEGRSTLNLDIARGLADGGVPCAIEVYDWTTKRLFYSLYHLRSTVWHKQQAVRLKAKIQEYQDAYPGRPVVLVGHSGGAALSLLALPLLEDRQIDAAIFLAAATARAYDTAAARRRTRLGIWSFHSPYDWLQLGIGTWAVGTFDGRRAISSGMLGFCEPPSVRQAPGAADADDHPDAAGDGVEPCGELPPLRQIRYHFGMLKSWNFGGHHGWSNRVFVAEWLAPIVLEATASN